MFQTFVIAAAIQVAGPVIVPPAVDWRVAGVTPGAWSWRPIAGGSEAIFQDYRGPQFTVRCTLASRTVTLIRAGAIGGAPLIVRTTSGERTLPPATAIAASQPFLDAIAFSRGRIAVESAGTQRLILPTWPEAARSIEDCRK